MSISKDEPTLRAQLTEGLSHEDRHVRDQCLNYWEKQSDRGAAQAHRIIDAVEAYGVQAFPIPQQAYDIPLDRPCFERLIKTLRDANCFNKKDREAFGRWFQWCLSVEYKMRPELEAFLKSDEALAFGRDGFVKIKELLERVKSMRRHELRDAEACHAGIQEALAYIPSVDGFPHKDVGEIESLFDQLIKVETPDRIAEFARSWLSLTPDSKQEDEDLDDANLLDDYKFGLGVYLAGKIGLTSGVDRIIDGIIQTDWDWLNESSEEALIQMPPVETTARLRARWWELPEHGRLYFSDVFVHAHLPEHRDFYIENMAQVDEHEFEIIPHRMACALAWLGDPESIKAATEYWQENAEDPNAFEVAEIIYTIHRLRDEDPPILGSIRERLIEREEYQAAAQKHMAMPAAHWERDQDYKEISLPKKHKTIKKAPKVGRNDPCPCGSGKKYKKCCL